MQVIQSFYGREPIVETHDNHGRQFGLHRDRTPDSGWSEWRSGLMEKSNGLTETDINTPEGARLRLILLEDLAHRYGSDTYKFRAKLEEFGFISELGGLVDKYEQELQEVRAKQAKIELQDNVGNSILNSPSAQVLAKIDEVRRDLSELASDNLWEGINAVEKDVEDNEIKPDSGE